MADLLIELGCEELPAASVVPMAQHLGKVLNDVLLDSKLCDTPPQIFATPRRIAAFFSNVGDRQADALVERRGPAKAAAYKDGEPTKALLGFLRSAQVDLADVKTVDTPKGEWIVVQQTQSGKTLSEVLAQALPDIIKTMPMPKRMRWSAHSHDFLRPVVWLLALHGSEVLPLQLLGLTASNTTRGHRFHAPGELLISEPSSYESTLEKAYVMAEPVKRRASIVNDVANLASTLGGAPVMDDDLVDEVNALVEWPVALAGSFDKEFLEIPKEALIQTMQENQRYFALLDEQGELLPSFITIANLESVNVQVVVDGNERVIRPRFADTMFFWNQDKKVSLASHQQELGRLLFQEKLGSVADKVARMGKLGQWLGTQLSVDTEEIATAVNLCKCDLNTEIVKELAKMQGICGRYYASREGYSASVAQAMEQHYFPKQAGGRLPESDISQVVSLADKTDTLVGIFGLGMIPTGTKDPFGLRRASIGIARIIIEQQRDLDLVELLAVSRESFEDRLPNPDLDALLAYVIERLRGYLSEQGKAADAIDAVLAKKITRPLDLVSRIDAIQQFRKSDAAVSLAAASKRIGNILKKVDDDLPEQVDTALFKNPAEKDLYQQLEALQPIIEVAMAKRDYATAMQDTAQLKQPVDAFFDDVMVMDEDHKLRANRLALLQRVNTLCCGTAELGLLRPEDPSNTGPGV
ncbi:MAG: glycine--tRNA ligase subunit beta [Granulosicoccus sp.]